MRDFIADLLGRLQATNRQQRLYLALGVVVLVVLLRYGAAWFVDYREGVKADIRLAAQRLASAEKLLERGPQVRQQLDLLRERYRKTVSELVPGDTPTLAAAELQDRVSSLAAKNEVRIQTTQVLKDEAVGPFRQVSLRITASGNIRNLAGLLAELEFGDLRVTIPFLELSRRGASIRRQHDNPQARAVSATFQVSGVVAGTAALPDAPAPVPGARKDVTPVARDEATTAPPPADGTLPAERARPPRTRRAAPDGTLPAERAWPRLTAPAPDGTLPAERARPPRMRAPAPDGTLPAERARPYGTSIDPSRVPADPLGTARTVAQ